MGKRASGVQSRIFEQFSKHQGEDVHVHDLMKDLDLTKKQIQAGVLNLTNRMGEEKLTVVIPGSVWRYNPNGHVPTGRRMFEEIGSSKTGAIVLQDEEGNLYRAEVL